jgi:hypothetical protein
MKKLLLRLAPALFVLVSGCSPTEPKDPDIMGTVATIRANPNVKDGVILLVTDATFSQGGLGSPIYVAVSPATDITIDHKSGPVMPGDIIVGSFVQVQIEAVVLDSQPQQTAARKIYVIYPGPQTL